MVGLRIEKEEKSLQNLNGNFEVKENLKHDPIHIKGHQLEKRVKGFEIF